MTFWQEIKSMFRSPTYNEAMRAIGILNDIKKRHNKVSAFLRPVIKPHDDGLSTSSIFPLYEDGRIYRENDVVHWGRGVFVAKRQSCGVHPVSGHGARRFWTSLDYFASTLEVMGEGE